MDQIDFAAEWELQRDLEQTAGGRQEARHG